MALEGRFQIRRVNPGAAPCKVCSGATRLFDVADFHSSCEEQRGKYLRLSGVPIYYRRCGGCGLIFTDAFDDWTPDQFKLFIYNDDYSEVDPDFATVRPTGTAKRIQLWFGQAAARLKILDYGGGNGLAASIMRSDGFDANTYDPFHPPFDARPAGRFNLITCIETFEHVTDPARLVEDIVSLLTDDGLVIFSTLVQPADVEIRRLSWWYAAPRNGHITLFSRPALEALWRGVGFQFRSFNDNLHAAYRTPPDFAKALFGS
jgi:SAM-dependent methyltransferase